VKLKQIGLRVSRIMYDRCAVEKEKRKRKRQKEEKKDLDFF